MRGLWKNRCLPTGARQPRLSCMYILLSGIFWYLLCVLASFSYPGLILRTYLYFLSLLLVQYNQEIVLSALSIFPVLSNFIIRALDPTVISTFRESTFGTSPGANTPRLKFSSWALGFRTEPGHLLLYVDIEDFMWLRKTLLLSGCSHAPRHTPWWMARGHTTQLLNEQTIDRMAMCLGLWFLASLSWLFFKSP